MAFNAVRVYDLTEPFPLSGYALGDLLKQHALQECKGVHLSTMGFLDPLDPEGPITEASQFVEHLETALLLCFGTHTKRPPASEVRRRCRVASAEFEARQGYKPGRTASADIKSKVIADMAAGMPSSMSYVHLLVDPAADRLLVFAGTSAAAETALEQLRRAMGSLPIIRPTESDFAAAMLREWLRTGSAGANMQLGGSFAVETAGVEKKQLRYKDVDLSELKDPSHLLAAGAYVTSLSIEFARAKGEEIFSDLAFTLKSDGTIAALKNRRLKEIVGEMETAADPRAGRLAELLVEVSEIQLVVKAISDELTAFGEVADEEKASAAASATAETSVDPTGRVTQQSVAVARRPLEFLISQAALGSPWIEKHATSQGLSFHHDEAGPYLRYRPRGAGFALREASNHGPARMAA